MKKLSSLYIREQIRRLNRIDRNLDNYKVISDIYKKIFGGLAVEIDKNSASEIYYRVRIAPKKPTLISELQAPPAALVSGFQRCNPPKVPMFYAASKRVGALLEARVSEGDTVYLSQWMAREPLPINRIFGEGETSSSTISGPNDGILLPYIDTLFTTRIHKDFSNDYKFTAAIAQQLTSRFPLDIGRNIHADGYVALRYSSVFRLNDTYNTVMHADFSNKRLIPLHVMELKINSIEDNYFSVDVKDNAYFFQKNVINWSGNINNVPLILHGFNGVPFYNDGGEYRILLNDAALNPEYLHRLLQE